MDWGPLKLLMEFIKLLFKIVFTALFFCRGEIYWFSLKSMRYGIKCVVLEATLMILKIRRKPTLCPGLH